MMFGALEHIVGLMSFFSMCSRPPRSVQDSPTQRLFVSCADFQILLDFRTHSFEREFRGVKNGPRNGNQRIVLSILDADSRQKIDRTAKARISTIKMQLTGV